MSANCSDMEKIPRMKASTGPEWDSVQIKISKDGSAPVVNVAWKLRGDGE